ncbi:BREX-1 system adenine-specific DNA-methyltransferase PglX [Pelobacter propionicus]|uniref:site-specific DNA-methyltransferase (adenine-specific) n=1 Tax=Pelobacter propionicus (strain DSM 2379 / NBRC 103807 / OttBd1) TaxID=338966 RepID=A1ARC5_PELPD|nr:BREX-1 system adenine-specific DNA-methyltransferase PglX [Pelobacter propionicus]ABK99895.1 type II restriction enzyme [Pelobacter propionicus DSM 2379]
MNKAKLKSYAPAARRDFIQAVTDRAHFFGLSESNIIPVEESGDVAIIGGRPFPLKVAAQRKKLEERVKREGFNQVMETVAYTWFNRFLALRFMELHGYLEHGFRVLSNSGNSTVPEILDYASELDLTGLDKQKVVELKLDGSKDAELYRLLLVAQCNALHTTMPFLFEKIEDETELLLPDNLLHSDSLIRKLVTEIEEEDWQEVEIIGWLYQFYISEKKDQVIGKVVKSEDIPAATQLFTPNWIVKYMAQNSLGRKWLATYPNSPLKAKMEYYIEPAEQTDDVKAQLAAITPDSLDPETLTLLDPACGSGHILVEAYDVFKEIYLERGYSNRDFPRLILEKNLYGLDIDDRAAQMAGFALLMKARKDDRRILRSDNPVKLNVMAIQESGDIAIDNSVFGEHANALRDVVDLFKNGKAFGSLIQIPEALAAKLQTLEEALMQTMTTGDLYAVHAANMLLPLVEQAKISAGRYDCVVANPPYMGSKFFCPVLKNFIEVQYKPAKGDLYTCFMMRNTLFTHKGGLIGMITIPNWMFLSTFKDLRKWLLDETTIETFIHNGRGVFGSDFGSCAFTFSHTTMPNYYGSYKRLFEKQGSVASNEELNERFASSQIKTSSTANFRIIPGSPIAYWLSNSMLSTFLNKKVLGEIAVGKHGMSTGNNNRFVRLWHEVSNKQIGFSFADKVSASDSNVRWFPYNKGGAYRKWYGNQEYVVNYWHDGYDMVTGAKDGSNSGFRHDGRDSYFKPCVSWSFISASYFGVRFYPKGFIFDVAGSAVFPSEKDLFSVTGFLCSKVAPNLMAALNPTINFQVGNVISLPYISVDADKIVSNIISIANTDWDFFETSWDFQSLPLLTNHLKSATLETSWKNWQTHSSSQIILMQELEKENNRLFIGAFGLQDELSPEVPEDQITLSRADREADMKRLISYAIGCMMGRYSLDNHGLIYANSGNIGFDPIKYPIFPADDDGIVPVIDIDWFPDDAACRFEEFLKVTWAPETLEENLKFVADSLSPKGSETPRETIRRYISTQFFKDHLQTYKKRPIYWLFSSGKQRAFECLVYLHRYNEATLSRMRNEYVTVLQGKFSAQFDYLTNEVNAATSTAERNRLQKQLDTLRKKQVELAAFDDLLRHYADQRISLDLDDGVKVNYGKFGALLAEVKVVTGSE